MKPWQFVLGQHKKVDLSVVESGNTSMQDGRPGILTHGAAKKARSEAINETKTDKCELTDMFKKKLDKNLTNGKQFVHDVIVKERYCKKTKNGTLYTNEFAVILVHEDINRILQLCTGPIITFHIDSTGSLVRDPSCHGLKYHNKSRILNYNIVLRVNNITYPIIEMISSMGNTEAVAMMMRALRGLMIDNVTNFKPKKVVMVSDWAPQNFNAAVHVFNSSTLITHINFLVTDQQHQVKLPIYPFNCVSHFVHAVAKYCEKHLDPQQIHMKPIIIQIFTTIIMARTYDEAFKIISDAIFIFFAEYDSTALSQRKAEFLQLLNKKETREEIAKFEKDADTFHFDNKNQEREDETFEMDISTQNRSNSVAYQRFLKVVTRLLHPDDIIHVFFYF